MANKYKVIDIEKWNRKSQFLRFNSFENTTYGLDVRLDVTNIVNYSKKTKTSFFINFLYALTVALNEVEEFRLRIVNGEVRLYEAIRPTYTIKCVDGTFNNGRHEYTKSYCEFYKRAHQEVEFQKTNTNHRENYNDSDYYDDFYFSCLPTLDFVGMTHPMIYGDKSSQSCTRALWGKYVLENGRYKMTLNLTASHALVDGFPMAEGFNKTQEIINDFENFIEINK